MTVMSAMHRVPIGVLLALLLVTGAGAQESRFQATVDRNPVGIGEQFTYSLTLTNAGVGGGKNLQLPDLSRFHTLAGPNQSSSMQFINGAVSSSLTYSYVLQPKDVGKFTIGPASIEAGGVTLASEAITLEVVKTSTAPRQQTRGASDATAQIGDNLFLRATIDKSRVLLGEQVNVQFKIYTRVSVVSYGIDKAPTYTGSWAEDIEVPKNIALTNEVVNGKQYRVGVIKRIALFPNQSGTLEISPMVVQTTVQVQSPRSGDPFDAFFRDPFGRNVNVPITSDPVRIKVDPLPGTAPDDFRGAVGQFAMSTAVDKKTTRTNEPVSIKITISGSGNIKLLEAPAIEFPPDFEQYTPKVSDNINRQGEKISGSKVFEFLLMPRYPGLKIIKPVGFSYFDLARREYVRLRSPQVEINVEQGAAAPPLIAGNAQEDVLLLSQDIRFIKTDIPSFTKTGERLHTSLLFTVLLTLPLAGLAGAIVYARQQEAARRDQAGYRNRRAIRAAQKGLKQAEYLLKEKSGSKGTPSSAQRSRFYSEVSRALWRYLGDKLNIAQAEFSIDRAVTTLGERSIDAGLTHALKVLLETCDLARFAPASLELGAMQRTYDEAKRIIVEIERTLK